MSNATINKISVMLKKRLEAGINSIKYIDEKIDLQNSLIKIERNRVTKKKLQEKLDDYNKNRVYYAIDNKHIQLLLKKNQRAIDESCKKTTSPIQCLQFKKISKQDNCIAIKRTENKPRSFIAVDCNKNAIESLKTLKQELRDIDHQLFKTKTSYDMKQSLQVKRGKLDIKYKRVESDLKARLHKKPQEERKEITKEEIMKMQGVQKTSCDRLSRLKVQPKLTERNKPQPEPKSFLHGEWNSSTKVPTSMYN